MMHMNFYWSTDVGDFFFKGLVINGTSSFVLLAFILFFLSIMYEGLKVHRTREMAKTARESQRAPSASESATLLSLDQQQLNTSNTPILKRLTIFFNEFVVFLFHNVLNYFLMLVVMLYNGYLFLAVVAGMTLGYFMFGHISMKINMENLQARQTRIMCSPRCGDAEENCPSTSNTTACPSASSSIVGESSINATVLQRIQRCTKNEQKCSSYGTASA